MLPDLAALSAPVASPAEALTALALAPVTIAGAAIAALLARPLGPPERAVLAAGLALLGLQVMLVPQAPAHDAWTHYLHLRHALGAPIGLLDPWDRPGFTLLHAAPAALGNDAARLASLVPAAIALAATMRTARALGLGHPWLAGALLLGQHDVFVQGASTMTELPCAAALAVAALGWVERRPALCAAGLGWAAITRPEGSLYALLGAAGLLRRRAPGAAAAALAPFALYLAVGSLARGDLAWYGAGNPYAGLVALDLSPGRVLASWFWIALFLGQPVVLLALEVAGALRAATGRAPRLAFLLAPLAALWGLLSVLRIGLHDGWRESRYLVALAPALALLAAEALDALLRTLRRRAALAARTDAPSGLGRAPSPGG